VTLSSFSLVRKEKTMFTSFTQFHSRRRSGSGAQYHTVLGCHPMGESTSFPPDPPDAPLDCIERFRSKRKRSPINLHRDRQRFAALFFPNSSFGLRQRKKRPLRAPVGPSAQVSGHPSLHHPHPSTRMVVKKSKGRRVKKDRVKELKRRMTNDR
jgi:hypothetical protein